MAKATKDKRAEGEAAEPAQAPAKFAYVRYVGKQAPFLLCIPWRDIHAEVRPGDVMRVPEHEVAHLEAGWPGCWTVVQGEPQGPFDVSGVWRPPDAPSATQPETTQQPEGQKE